MLSIDKKFFNKQEKLLTSHLINRSSYEPLKFKEHNKFLEFYSKLIETTSKSPYEKGIFDKYINYLNKSNDILQEPFLIPELRYAGNKVKHRYRLDYTILNPYIMKMTGFEISPASTHMSVQKVENKNKTQINNELSEQWSKEMDKRNSYFSKYGINTITFTNKELNNIDKCFEKIENYLKEKSSNSTNLQTTMSKFEDLTKKYKL